MGHRLARHHLVDEVTNVRHTCILALALTSAVSCHQAPASRIVPNGMSYLSRADWGAKAPVLPMRTHTISRLTIHHTGVKQAPARSTAEKIRGLQLFSQRDDSLSSGKKKPAWPDVPYHLYVGIDGTVAEGREWQYVGDSNTPYDPTGHLLVVVEGSFDTEQLTAEQRRSLDVLLPSLVKRFDIAPERIAGHRDFAETSCPGKNLYSELERYREMARAGR